MQASVPHFFFVSCATRPATARLAARRLTSHSKGQGSVSSKSLRSKIGVPSGVAYEPKFAKWASPQACNRIPVLGMVARSAAMIAAAPRKNANGSALHAEIAQPGCRLDLSDLLAAPTQRGRSAAVGAAGRVPPCVSRPVAQSGWRGVNVQDFGPCLSPCHCRRQNRVLYSTFRGT